MKIVNGMKRIFLSLLKIREFCEIAIKQNEKEFLKQGLKDLTILLILCALIVSVTAIIGNKLPADFRIAPGANVPPEILENLNRTFIPWNRILFPLVWLTGILLFSLIRFSALKILDEKNRSFNLVAGITCYSMVPFILATTFIDSMNDLFPLRPYKEMGFFFYLQLGISLVLLFSAWIREGFMCVSAYQILFAQNKGRAILTWLTPIFIFAGLYLIMNQILIFISD